MVRIKMVVCLFNKLVFADYLLQDCWELWNILAFLKSPKLFYSLLNFVSLL